MCSLLGMSPAPINYAHFAQIPRDMDEIPVTPVPEMNVIHLLLFLGGGGWFTMRPVVLSSPLWPLWHVAKKLEMGVLRHSD